MFESFLLNLFLITLAAFILAVAIIKKVAKIFIFLITIAILIVIVLTVLGVSIF